MKTRFNLTLFIIKYFILFEYLDLKNFLMTFCKLVISKKPENNLEVS